MKQTAEQNKNIKDALQMAFNKGYESAQSEIEKLKAFKDYVHKRLDDAGVEKDPESEHKEKGCRIGGRLDIVLKLKSEKEKLTNIITEAALTKTQ